MKIELKQAEIIAALKMYVGAKGIDLHHKEVNVAFTAGRKKTGLSVEMNIEDSNPVSGEMGIQQLATVTFNQLNRELDHASIEPAEPEGVEVLTATQEETPPAPRTTSLFS